MTRSAPLGVLGVALALGWVTWARAQVPARDLKTALSQLPDGGAAYVQGIRALDARSPSSTVPLLLELGPKDPVPAGAVHVTERWYVIHADIANQRAPLPAHRSMTMSGMRHPQLSVAYPRIRAARATQDYGLSGDGSVVGVVDTGADLAHPALRHEDGTTRVRWLLSYGREPLGYHPELEEEYGCTSDDPCAIYGEDEINDILASGDEQSFPQDAIGHGTHVASIAAGRDAEYPGVAPDADLIVVAAADEQGGVYDSRILIGCRFIFERAELLRKPAVVNISLGSDFGSHRGDSEIEQALTTLAQGKGRAVVVAAGNSGGRYEGILPDEFAPFGSHAEYAVTPGSELRVPVLQYSTNVRDISGAIYLWLATDPGQKVEIAFSTDSAGQLSEWIGPGEVGAASSESWGDSARYDLAILNATGDTASLELAPGNAVISVVGRFASDRRFEFALRGDATLALWTTGTGQAAYGGSSLGPLLPRAQARGTIQIPGAAAALISVGATVNRTEWTDYTGNTVGTSEAAHGLAYFSSQGPNQLGQLKPELVAPGEWIIAAMAGAADPREQRRTVSQFDDQGACPGGTECYVIDDLHGIASGTSMAAPLVTGTIALMLQRDPELTMSRAKAYLMAGARDLTSAVRTGFGTGEVDVVGALLAQEADAANPAPTGGATIDDGSSFFVWADAFVQPAPGPGLSGQVVLRDDDGRPLSVSLDDLQLEVEGPGSGELEVTGPGLLEVRLRAEPGSAGDSLAVRLTAADLELIDERVDIDLDPVRAEHGHALAGGTCAHHASHARGSSSSTLGRGALLLMVGLAVWRQRVARRRQGDASARPLIVKR